MKKNSICKIIVSGLLAAVPLIGMAQQVCGNNQKWCVVPNLGNWIFRPV